MFKTLRSSVMGQSWYENGYLANIVSYSLSKLRFEFKNRFPNGHFDLGKIWKAQALEEALLDQLLEISQLVLHVLTDDSRPVANVTQWAKQESCWDLVRAAKFEISDAISSFAVDSSERAEAKKVARKTQALDTGIAAQTLAVKQPIRFWEKILGDPAIASDLSPVDMDLVRIMMKPRAVPSEKQAERLVRILSIAVDNGTIPKTALEQ